MTMMSAESKQPIVGFTGTRKGMTPAQRQSVELSLIQHAPREVHHGSAIGADEEFHSLALGHGIQVHLHPCSARSQQARCEGASKVWMTVDDPLARNRHIVDALDVLIAAPGGNEEELRSGTWATIRYARKRDRPIVLCWPDGRITTE